MNYVFSLKECLILALVCVVIIVLAHLIVYKKPIVVVKHERINNKHIMGRLGILLVFLIAMTIGFLADKFFAGYLFAFFAVIAFFDGYMEKRHNCDKTIYRNSFLCSLISTAMFITSIVIALWPAS